MSKPTMEGKAIFISYAREDSVAADRIAEVLRSHGLEVWFDQNELRGGDTWDQKIRGQIRTCTLLIPIVSANSQSRGEGYFRREWKLAAERTHDMAAGIPFIVPVVIDDTAESAALVPEEFMRVQWSRLPHGRTTPEFAAQVKRLLEAPRGVEPTRPAVPGTNQAPVQPSPEVGRALRARPLVIGVITLLALAGISGWIFLRPTPPAPEPAARRSAPPTSEKSAAPKLDARSVAVLPFENLSPEPDSAFFADGMHEEVLTAIAKVSALRVTGRTSVLPFADPKKRDLRAIAEKLGVANVVEGTVRRAGNRVRIAVQLVDAQTSRQLWGDTYEKELTDVFAIQSAIAQEVATTLKTALTAGERETIGQQRTQNAEAYRLYLQARAMLRDVGTPRPTNRDKVEAAIGLYEQAAAADPGFALPHVELTRWYGSKYWFGFFNPTPEFARRAEASAARVRVLMPNTPEVRLAAGYVAYLCRYNWAEALTEFRAAHAGLPNSPDAVRFESFALRRLGRIGEAIEALERSLVIDPQDMLGWDSLTESQLFARRYAETIRTADAMAARGMFSDTMVGLRAYAQLALDGNVERYRRELRPIRGNLARGFLPDLGWRGDLFARDFATVEAFFAESGGFISGINSVVSNPVAQFRALAAFAQGDPARARAQAEEARRHYESLTWMPRQLSMVAAELALDHALMGNPAKAREELTRSHDLQAKLPDALVESGLHYLWAVTHTALGEREAALAELRASVGQLSNTQLVPPLAPLDPTWDSLKKDPRFEEILKAAKPL